MCKWIYVSACSVFLALFVAIYSNDLGASDGQTANSKISHEKLVAEIKLDQCDVYYNRLLELQLPLNPTADEVSDFKMNHRVYQFTLDCCVQTELNNIMINTIGKKL